MSALFQLILILDLTGFDGLDKDSHKMRRETFQSLGLVRFILEVGRYMISLAAHMTTHIQCNHF